MKAKAVPDQNKLRSVFDYLPETGDLVWLATGIKAGSVCGSGYVTVQLEKERYQAHRVIWAICYGTIPENMMIDHIDGNRKNNRLANLRLADDQQNQYNRCADAGRTFKGVYKHKRKWKAEITANKKRVYLGLFDSPELAYAAYKQAATELHGNHARV